jgi:hypothetical protein
MCTSSFVCEKTYHPLMPCPRHTRFHNVHISHAVYRADRGAASGHIRFGCRPAKYGRWLAKLAKSGLLPHEFGIFVRSPAQLDRAPSAAAEAGMPFKILDERVDTTSGHVSICACTSVSKPSATTLICKMSTRPNDTFGTLPIPVRETICWSRALNRHPNF